MSGLLALRHFPGSSFQFQASPFLTSLMFWIAISSPFKNRRRAGARLLPLQLMIPRAKSASGKFLDEVPKMLHGCSPWLFW
jgi:hypothetical protein